MDELKSWIRRSGIERKKLAELIGVPYHTLSNYLNGFSPMPDHVREDIERVLLDVDIK